MYGGGDLVEKWLISGFSGVFRAIAKTRGSSAMGEVCLAGTGLHSLVKPVYLPLSSWTGCRLHMEQTTGTIPRMTE